MMPGLATLHVDGGFRTSGELRSDQMCLFVGEAVQPVGTFNDRGSSKLVRGVEAPGAADQVRHRANRRGVTFADSCCVA
jgi:hypothetical protein